MKSKKELLIEMEKIIALDNNYHIDTINKNTNWEGTAIILKDKKTIRVYEGNGDGRDDKSMSIDEFINNYNFQLRWY